MQVLPLINKERKKGSEEKARETEKPRQGEPQRQRSDVKETKQTKIRLTISPLSMTAHSSESFPSTFTPQ